MNNIGIDLGNTIVGNGQLNNKTYVDPDCFNVLKLIIKNFDNVYIISRVNSEQRDHSLKWLAESDFFNKTGIKRENLYYCWERRDKAIFAKALNCSIFIDDQPEVIYNLDKNIYKLLINPTEIELNKYKDKLFNYDIVNNWIHIKERLKL